MGAVGHRWEPLPPASAVIARPKVLSHAKETPLLSETLPPGLFVAAVRLSRSDLEDFHGEQDQESTSSADVDAEKLLCKICLLAVTETSLVHWCRKPKGPAATQASAGAAELKDDHAAASESAMLPAATGTSCERPAEIDENYWKRRYNYFSRFDEGIRMDPAGWFEVTPESVARHIADRMRFGLVVDGTCGVGGNAIQFAMSCRRVIAVDTDASRLEDAAHNASIYGVRDRIDFVCDDFAHFALTYSGAPIEAVFLSPPWGGPAHLEAPHFSLKDVPCPDIVRLFAAAAAVSRRVVLYLPRHTDLNEMALLASAHGFGACEIEKVFFEYPTPHLKLVMVHFTPEAATTPLRSARGVKKIGQTGAAIGIPGGPAGMTARDSAIASRGIGLWGLPPLAGPIIRAFYCRFHYVGKFAVAVALAVDAQEAERRRCHSSLRKHASIAFSKAALPIFSGHGEAGCKEESEIARHLEWMLGQVPLADLTKFLENAMLPRTGASSGTVVRLRELLRRHLPQVGRAHDAWMAAGHPQRKS